MYLYIYDSFLSQKKYQTTVAKIETRLNDLGISGKICRLNILRNTSEIIEDALKKNTTTVIAVGDDRTLSQVVNLAANFDVVVGYIPVDNNNLIANKLGLASNELACECVAQRLIKKLDLGKVNDSYFIDNANFSGGIPVFDFQDFQISPESQTTKVTLANLTAGQVEASTYNPTDGQLEIVIKSEKKSFWRKTKRSQASVFPFTKVKIKSITEPALILLDGLTLVKSPAEATVCPQKLKIIVGNNRQF